MKSIKDYQQNEMKLYLAKGETVSVFVSAEEAAKHNAYAYLQEQAETHGFDGISSLKEITKLSQVPKGWYDVGIWGVENGLLTAREWFSVIKKVSSPGHQKLLQAKAKLVEAQTEYNKLREKYDE